MLQILVELPSSDAGMAQVVVHPPITPEQASLMFSGPQFLIALFAGVMMALGFQLLLTNLSVAILVSPSGSEVAADDVEDAKGVSDTVRRIENRLGAWILATISLALFIACFLAVKLSLLNSAVLGSIVGVVVWATYFSLLLWFGSTAMGSLFGSFISTATSGIQGLLGTVTAAIGANAAKNQAVETAEDVAAAVRRELLAGVTPDKIQETLQNSIAQLPKLNLDDVREQFRKILDSEDLQGFVDSDLIRNLNRESIVNLIGDRTNFSKAQIEQIADQLESVLKSVQKGSNQLPGELLNFFQSENATALRSSDVYDRLQNLIEASLEKNKQGTSVSDRALEYGTNALISAVRNRVDLADADVETISGRLQKLLNQITTSVEKVVDDTVYNSQTSNTIKTDVENYVLGVLPWHLNRFNLQDEFRQVIYDPEANPRFVRQQLEELNQTYFADLLSQRGDLSPGRVEESAQLMEQVRQEVLEIVKQTESQEHSETLRDRLENYLRTAEKENLTDEEIRREIQSLIDNSEVGSEALQERFRAFDRNTIANVLKERQDIGEEELNQILDRVEQTRDQALATLQERATQLRQRIEDYLRNTNQEELDPEGIRRDLTTLFNDPEAGAYALRARLSHFDRDTLVKLLSQRGDLTEEQINRAIDNFQSTIDDIVKTPRRFAKRVQNRVSSFESNLESYLRNTDKEELNPESIKRDLQLLLSDPRAGVGSISDRLSKIDRETIVALLAQRKDITEEEANQIVDQVLSVRENIVAQFQQLQERFQSVLDRIVERIRTYLDSLNRPELNYEGIKQDFIKLFDDPKAGVDALSARLSRFDRDTLIAVLSSREDISEEDANRIIAQVESARDSVLQQAETIQRETQRRISQVKYQAQKRAVETQKAAARAAWWLFGAALTSLVTSAVAGALAVIGISGLYQF